ncbi:MAG: hypothetical protein ABIF92_02765 [archaeon]
MTELPNSSLTKTSGKKNLLMNHETLLILGVIVAAIIILSIFFTLLWTYFKLGFVCVITFILIVVTRKTDSWKMGIECFYICAFLFGFAISPYVAILVVSSAIMFVIKFFRPDELAGAITQVISTSGVAFTGMFFFSHYGVEITHPQLVFAGTFAFVLWDLIRFFIALKITPAHWVKLFASLTTGAFINYFYYSTFGFYLLHLLLKI